MRFRPRLDSTQKEIVNALRKAGYSVRSLASVGNGCPDLLVGCPQGNVLLEAKSKRAKTHKVELTKDAAFALAWTGPCFTVYSAEEALARLQEYEKGGPLSPPLPPPPAD